MSKHNKKKRKNNITYLDNRYMHIKLDILNPPENESFRMLMHYKFDEESVNNIIQEVKKEIMEAKVSQERKEYEEMNYYAMYRRFSKYSMLEVIKELFQAIASVCNNSILNNNTKRKIKQS